MKRIFLLGLILLLTSGILEASPPSRDNTYTSGTTISPTDVMANENVVFTYLQNGVDTIADGSVVSTDILDNTITTSDILDATITTSDISASAGITDTQLATISTASKVNTTALTTTTGAIGQLLANDGDSWEAIAKGTNGQYLQSTAGVPIWTTISTTDVTTTGFGDGLVGTPSVFFTNDTNTGFYRIGADNMGLSLNGTKYVDIGTGEIAISQSLNLGTPTTLTNRLYTSSQGSGTLTHYIGSYTIDTTNPSDESIKNILGDSDKGLTELSKLKVKKFKFTDKVDDTEKQKVQYGFSAQDVEKQFPEAVFTRSDGLKAIDYKKLIPFMIQSIQELEARVKALENP